MSANDLIRCLRGGVLAVAVGVTATLGLLWNDPQAWAAAGIVAIAAVASCVTVVSATGTAYRLSAGMAVAAPALLMTEAFAIRILPAAVTIAIGLAVTHIGPVLAGVGPRDITRSILRHALLSGVAMVIYASVVGAWSPMVGADRGEVAFVGVSAAMFAWFVLFMSVPGPRDRTARGLMHRWRDHLPEWPVAVTILATGGFLGVLWQEMTWWWAIIVALVPYSFAHAGFTLSDRTARTYRATITALSRVPEVAGLTPDGHSVRTARLGVAVAEELGMPTVARAELEQAALLHDIGRLVLSQPSILRRGFSDDDIARWSADMIREAPSLLAVADVVALQNQPYRRPGEQHDPDLPIGSKIIRVASAYDHAVHDLGFSPLEALEELHRGAAYDFDPEVVGAARTVLERRGAL
jgi:hypothetical protein